MRSANALATHIVCVCVHTPLLNHTFDSFTVCMTFLPLSVWASIFCAQITQINFGRFCFCIICRLIFINHVFFLWPCFRFVKKNKTFADYWVCLVNAHKFSTSEYSLHAPWRRNGTKFHLKIHVLFTRGRVSTHYRFDRGKHSKIKQCNRMQSLCKRIRSKNSTQEFEIID